MWRLSFHLSLYPFTRTADLLDMHWAANRPLPMVLIGRGKHSKAARTKSRTNAKVGASAASVLAWITPMISLCILISTRKTQLCLYHLYDCPIPSIRDPCSPTHSHICCQSSGMDSSMKRTLHWKCVFASDTPQSLEEPRKDDSDINKLPWDGSWQSVQRFCDAAPAASGEAAVVLG